jgi:hypothetical protein
VLTLFAYVILYKFSPTDAAANSTIAAALITPLTTHIFTTIALAKGGENKAIKYTKRYGLVT